MAWIQAGIALVVVGVVAEMGIQNGQGFVEDILQQGQVEQDEGIGVVDLMGHSSRQFPQRCQSAGLVGLFAQLELFGDVAGQLDDLVHRTHFILQG